MLGIDLFTAKSSDVSEDRSELLSPTTNWLTDEPGGSSVAGRAEPCLNMPFPRCYKKKLGKEQKS